MVDEILRQGGYKPSTDPLASLLESATGGAALNGGPADAAAQTPAIESERRD